MALAGQLWVIDELRSIARLIDRSAYHALRTSELAQYIHRLHVPTMCNARTYSSNERT